MENHAEDYGRKPVGIYGFIKVDDTSANSAISDILVWFVNPLASVHP
jgi:hypothetical protein